MGTSELVKTDGAGGKSLSEIVGNERLTALAGSVLLMGILIELTIAVNLHVGITFHSFVLVGYDFGAFGDASDTAPFVLVLIV